MSGIWGKMKAGGSLVKVKGEIALMERDITTRKRQFGVELYDLVLLNHVDAAPLPKALAEKEDKLRAPISNVKSDVTYSMQEREAKQVELDKLSTKRERQIPATNSKEYFDNAGTTVVDSGKQAKLYAQISMLDRKIKQRKESFGVEVFDILINTTTNYAVSGSGAAAANQGTGFVAAVATQVGQIAGSNKEKDLEDLMTKATVEVTEIRVKKEAKERQVTLLEAELKG